MADRYRVTKKQWDATHAETVRRSKAEYDSKNPIWSFRPTPEMLEWLNQERWEDERTGKTEANSALIIRKLAKLMNLENQGY
jgi:hypothetical protein